MENNEKTLTPEESLLLIKKMIFNSRKNIREGRFYFLLWGWVLILASILDYFLIRYLLWKEVYQGMYIKSLICWGIMIFIGVTIQFIYKARQDKKEVVRTHLDRHFTILWSAAGVAMGLTVLFCFKYDIYPTPFILAITGMVTFVSGMLVKYNPLIFGSIVFVSGSVIALFLGGLPQLLLFAGTVVLGYLVPGYLIRTVNENNHV